MKKSMIRELIVPISADMSEKTGILQRIESEINQAAQKFIDEHIKTEGMEQVYSVINYNTTRNTLFTTISFRVFSLLSKNWLETDAQGVAEQIVKITGSNDEFELKTEKGYINIYLSDLAIITELERISQGDNSQKKEQISFDISDETFPIWYSMNRIETAFKYLWEQINKEDGFYDIPGRDLAVNLIYLDYKKDISVSDLLYFTDQFYNFDRQRTNSQIPFKLYYPILIKLRQLTGKINK